MPDCATELRIVYGVSQNPGSFMPGGLFRFKLRTGGKCLKRMTWPDPTFMILAFLLVLGGTLDFRACCMPCPAALADPSSGKLNVTNALWQLLENVHDNGP